MLSISAEPKESVSTWCSESSTEEQKRSTTSPKITRVLTSSYFRRIDPQRLVQRQKIQGHRASLPVNEKRPQRYSSQFIQELIQFHPNLRNKSPINSQKTPTGNTGTIETSWNNNNNKRSFSAQLTLRRKSQPCRPNWEKRFRSWGLRRKSLTWSNPTFTTASNTKSVYPLTRNTEGISFSRSKIHQRTSPKKNKIDRTHFLLLIVLLNYINART